MKTLALAAIVGSMDGPDDRSQTIAAARSGDLAAFELLMRQYERPVLGTALRLLGNLEDAQDASQEAFLKLYRNLRKLERQDNIPAWLYRVTVNVCHDLGRKRKPTASIHEAEAEALAAADPPGEDDRRRALMLSLRRLSEKERAAVVLRDLEGLSTGEVARAMGSSEATVRSQISQARAKMREFLERYFRRRL
jgi:RNA polymerase sigma-70 factor (ECF subfamily)